MHHREIFVTGIGLVTPAGTTAAATWSALMAGCRMVRPLKHPAITEDILSFAGQVLDEQLPAGGQDLDRAGRFALSAAMEALAHAGWSRAGAKTGGRGRLSLCTGLSKPFIGSHEQKPVVTAGTYCEPHHGLVGQLQSTAGVSIASCHTTVAACSTGAHTIIRACQLIEDGDAEAVLCGCVDTPLHPLWAATYRAMGTLAEPHPERGCAWACRPFDHTRNGFAVGEGAGMLLLESAESVRRRAVEPAARLIGWAMGTDPLGMTRATESAEPLARTIRIALERANCGPDAVACVHAHGTATLTNDVAEVDALRSVFGRTGLEVPIVSVKGAIGHLMGAAGAIETGIACLSVKHGQQPGNTTLIEPDPAFSGAEFPQEPFQGLRGAVLKISLGFGGHLGAIVVAPA